MVGAAWWEHAPGNGQRGAPYDIPGTSKPVRIRPPALEVVMLFERDGSGVFGRNLMCECGEGAKDVAQDYEIAANEAIQWTCHNGHIHISGARPGHKGFQQMRFDKP